MKNLYEEEKPQYAFTLVYSKPFKLHGYFTKVRVTDYILVFCISSYLVLFNTLGLEAKIIRKSFSCKKII